MAATGPALYPGSATFPGSTTYPGGGDLPQIEVLYSTDDATDPTPTWVYAHTGLTGDLRGYSVDRGRGSELETMDAATATIVLSNRARGYDPNRVNLCTNPSFEGGDASGWTSAASFFLNGGAVFAPYDSVSVSGNCAGLVVCNGAATLEGVAFQSFSVVSGRTYTFSVYVFHNSGSTNLALGVGAGGGIGFAQSSFTSVVGVYTRFQVSFTATGSGLAQAAVYCNPAAASNFQIDGAQIEEGSAATPYIDRGLLTPMNRWWIRAKFGGETQDRFKGYADSYSLTWPEKGKDSVTTVHCTDELKILNLDALPLMSPPRDSYADVVAYDDPSGYWVCDQTPNSNQILATVGEPFLVNAAGGTVTNYTDNPVLGFVSDSGYYSVVPSAGMQVGGIEATAEQHPLGDVAANYMSVEFWVNISGPAGGTNVLVFSPLDGTDNPKWQVFLNASSQIQGWLRSGAGVTYTVTSSALTAGQWYHVVWELQAGTGVLYLNGVLQGTVVMAAGCSTTLSATPASGMGVTHPSTATAKLSQIAFYSHYLGARALAHYEAGQVKGYPTQNTAVRVGAVLDSVANTAPRSLRTGAQSIVGVFQRGQSPLDEIRNAVDVDDVDAMFFCARDGTLTFLDAAHRSVSPWFTVQAEFDDDGTALGYMEAAQDLSEAFLFNEWNVTREGGLTQTSSDAASVARYKKRSQSITGLLVTSDGVAATIAAGKLAKYKDPFELIPTFDVVLQNSDVALGVLRRELGDFVEVIRRPIGGGGLIDQLGWIQSISEDGSPDGPIRVRLGVSPR